MIQYVYAMLGSISGILLIASFDLMLERDDARLLGLCVILGITSWTGLYRLFLAETMKVRELDYVMDARAMGVF